MITREMRVGGKLRKFECYPIIEKCEGCSHAAVEGEASYCDTYAKPDFQWKNGNCIASTHIEHHIVSAAEQKVNPLKASKRASRGR